MAKVQESNISYVEPERLDVVYANNKVNTNDLIVRIMNTILGEISDPFFLNNQFKYYNELLKVLIKTNDRNEINYMLNEISQFDGTIESLMKLLARNITVDANEAHKLYIVCYLRTEFDTRFAERIGYENPKYTVLKRIGREPWEVFLECFKNSDNFILF